MMKLPSRRIIAPAHKLFLVTLLTLSATLLTGLSAAGESVFHADLQECPVTTSVTEVVLNTGTATGAWTVTDNQESEVVSSSGNRALMADKGMYDFTYFDEEIAGEYRGAFYYGYYGSPLNVRQGSTSKYWQRDILPELVRNPTLQESVIRYVITSAGPDRFLGIDRVRAVAHGLPAAQIRFYDSSNGTRSVGDLLYFGPR